MLDLSLPHVGSGQLYVGSMLPTTTTSITTITTTT